MDGASLICFSKKSTVQIWFKNPLAMFLKRRPKQNDWTQPSYCSAPQPCSRQGEGRSVGSPAHGAPLRSRQTRGSLLSSPQELLTSPELSKNKAWDMWKQLSGRTSTKLKSREFNIILVQFTVLQKERKNNIKVQLFPFEKQTLWSWVNSIFKHFTYLNIWDLHSSSSAVNGC